MEQNEHEISQSQGRKIDLLLVTKGCELELASNEWKTFRTKRLILQQQSKNLRCNAAILNNLYISSKGKVNTVMAVDFVGKELNIFWSSSVTDCYCYRYNRIPVPSRVKRGYVRANCCPAFVPAH